MIFLGVKLTHDGGFALCDDGVLVCSIEAEKLGNAPRYAILDTLDTAIDYISHIGYALNDIAALVVDGWDTHVPLTTFCDGIPISLVHESYCERNCDELLTSSVLGALTARGVRIPTVSYRHVAGHVFGALLTYPGQVPRISRVLAWDGGIPPILYTIDTLRRRVLERKQLHPILGSAYSTLSQFFHPFRRSPPDPFALDLAGKVMAYSALGVPREAIVNAMTETFSRLFRTDQLVFEADRDPASIVSCGQELSSALSSYDDSDCIASLQFVFGKMLMTALGRILKDPVELLCFGGGCALRASA